MQDAIQCDHHRYAELLHAGDVMREVRQAQGQRVEIFTGERLLVRAALHLE